MSDLKQELKILAESWDSTMPVLNGNPDIVQSVVPGCSVGNSNEFEQHRTRLNAVLSLSGLEFGKDGLFRKTTIATTLDQAEAQLKTIQRKLHGRSIHHEVTKYCRTELLQDNYFHAVFEAAKGLGQRIPDLSGIEAMVQLWWTRFFQSKILSLP